MILNATETLVIAVFSKAPIPGQVKTRMIPRLGATGAAKLQEHLLRRTLQTAVDAQLGPVTLWCDPACEHPAFATFRDQWGLLLFQQRGDDLGARMLNAFAILCERGPVLLIGTDCPIVTPSRLRRAAEILSLGHDAVFFPAEDGGYVLVGLRRPEPLLFDNMPWGSDQVMSETRLRLSQLKLKWAEPEVLWDLDRPEDLDRLHAGRLLDEFSG